MTSVDYTDQHLSTQGFNPYVLTFTVGCSLPVLRAGHSTRLGVALPILGLVSAALKRVVSVAGVGCPIVS